MGRRERTFFLIAEQAVGPDRAWLEHVADLASPAERPATAKRPGIPETDALGLAQSAIDSGQHRNALQLLGDLTPTRRSVELQVTAALGLGGFDAAQVVAESFEALDEQEQTVLEHSPLLGSHLKNLLALGADSRTIANWRQWLARLSADAPFEQAMVLAELGATEWPTQEPLTSDDAASLADAIRGVPDRSRPVLERALPSLLRYLDRRAQPDTAAAPVYGALLDVLAFGTARTPAVREAALVVLGRLLEGAPTTEDYREIVESVSHIWDDVRAASVFGWLLDVLVALLHHPCPDPSPRMALMSRALVASRSLRDVDDVDVEMLRILATDPAFDGEFDAEAQALPRPSEEETNTSVAALGHRVVGIYTLSEPAAHRAKALLEERYPEIDVELNHEHDDSERLRGLARRADVMAVVIASAKHAATEGIDRACSPGALLEVRTAGSSGLVRAVIGRLEELAAA